MSSAPANASLEGVNNQLFELQRRDSEANRQFLGPSWRIAQFADVRSLTDIRLYPEQLAQNCRGATLRVRISGGSIAPSLRFELRVRSPDDEETLLHEAWLEFSTCQRDQFKQYLWKTQEAKGSGPSKPRGARGDQPQHKPRDEDFRIAFSTLGGVGCALDYRHPDFNRETLDILEYMQSLVKKDDDATWKRVNVLIAFRANKLTEKQRLEAAVKGLQHAKQPTWAPYKNSSGTPMTQYGAFVARAVVKEETGGSVISYPARHYFDSLSEGKIKLTYGSGLEHQYQTQLFQFVSNRRHTGFFIDIGGRAILAFVRLNLENLPEVAKESFSIRDGTLAKLEWRPAGHTPQKPHCCTAIVTPNMFGFPYTETMMLVTGKPANYFKHVVFEPHEKPTHMPLRVTVWANDAGVRRQIDAVNKLCSGTNRWQSLFLNHSSALPIMNPVDALNLSDGKVEETMAKILQSNKIHLDPEQVRCVESCTKMPGRVLLIQGLPGCGKSWTISAMAKVFLLLGMHVILAAPTHAAADALCKRFSQFEQTLADNMETPIRVYGGFAEMQAFLKENKEQRFTEDSGQDAEEEPVDETTLTMLYLTSMFKDRVSRSKRSLASMSVEAMAVRMAEEGTRDVMATYPQPKSNNRQISDRSYGDGGDEEETRWESEPELDSDSDNDEFYDARSNPSDPHDDNTVAEDTNVSQESDANTGAETSTTNVQTTETTTTGQVPVNMVRELKTYLDRMKQSNPKTWDEEDQRNAKYAFKKVCEFVVSEARIVVSTNNNLGGSLLSQNFGDNSRGIVLFRDEDTKELEASGWIGPTMMKHSDKIEALVLCGDEEQLRPTVISDMAATKTNEFSQQLTVPLPVRLRESKTQVIELTRQHRMRPALAEFPNLRVYNGKMQNAANVESIRVNAKYQQMMRAWTGNTKPNADMGRVILDIAGAVCEIEEHTKSRFNRQNVKAIADLLVRNHRANGYAAHEICVMTAYRAQKTRILQALYQLSRAGYLPKDAHPHVDTIENLQGEEYDLVICDFVVTDLTTPSGLGHTRDERRCNVALTRAKSASVVLLPQTLADYGISRRKGKDPIPVAYLRFMLSRKAVYSIGPTARADQWHRSRIRFGAGFLR